MSDEELIGRVLNSRNEEEIMDDKKNTKKRSIKMIVIPLTAAIVTAATTVGAVAAYQRNLSQEYNDVLAQGAAVFPQEYKNSDGEAITMPVDSELYEQLNIVIDKTFGCGGFTLEVPGAICDGKDMLVMYNVIFDEEPKYKENENVYIDYTPETEGVGCGGTRYNERVFSERDGKTVISNFFELTDIENCTDAIKVKLNSLWGSSMNNDDEGIRDLNIDLEIPLTGDLTRFNKTIKAIDTPHIDLGGWCEWDVTDVEITPLSVKFNTKTDGAVPEGNPFKIAFPEFPVNVTFKDGSVLDLGSYAISNISIEAEDKTGSFKANFNYPINVDDVQSVQFAGAVISEDGTAKTVDVPEPVDRYTKANG